MRPNAEVWDSAGMTLEETTQALAEACAAGRRAVRLHTGDPAIYGAIQEQMAALDQLGIDYEVVPGVTSAFAAAAALKQELTLPEVSQTVIITRLAGRTPVPERERLAEIARIGATLVIYLSVAMIDQVVAELLQGAYNEETPAAVVARASWPDEQVLEGRLADIAAKVRGADIGKQAVIIVGDVLKARSGGLAGEIAAVRQGVQPRIPEGNCYLIPGSALTALSWLTRFQFLSVPLSFGLSERGRFYPLPLGEGG